VTPPFPPGTIGWFPWELRSDAVGKTQEWKILKKKTMQKLMTVTVVSFSLLP
jgi:hypothetical protein